MIYTVGHSTRSKDELLDLLKHHEIQLLVDIRTIPRSRHNPQFNRDEFAEALAQAQITYRHHPGLGGLRHPKRDSPNTGWRNASFRGFADYMQTPQFEAALSEMLQWSEQGTLALMCAEALYWRCHRMLVSDALLVRNVPVQHIQNLTSVVPHFLTRFARVHGAQITYPAEESGQSSLDFLT